MDSVSCPSCGGNPMLSVEAVERRTTDDNSTLTDAYEPVFELDVSSQDFFAEVYCCVIQEGRIELSVRRSDIELVQMSIDERETPPFTLSFINCAITDLTDPSWNAVTRRQGSRWTLHQLALILGATFRRIQNLNIGLKRKLRFCGHGVVLHERLCTSFPLQLSRTVFGLCSFVHLTMPLASKVLDAMRPVDPQHFEVAPEEEAIPFRTFQSMEDWSTRSCTDDIGLVARRKWGHLLFLSHKWRAPGVPGTREDLGKMQHVVDRYVQNILHQIRDKSAKATVKNVASEDDFGIWLDYPIIPNDRSHVENCETCQQKRRSLIAKMNALPTVSTVIAFNPDDDTRGWILHELSNNSHGNVTDFEGNPLEGRLDHRHRVNLMAKNRLHFTNGSDGDALRCYEFLRLGQMPRCWPSVSRVLLREWKGEGIEEESHPNALSILLKYARTFHYDCQRLKRAMIEVPQQLAWSGVGHREESGWVQILSPQPNFSFDDEAGSMPLERADGPFDFGLVRHEIDAQLVDMTELGLRQDICDATTVLQRMQFLGVTLGLRAQLLHGQGLLHWIVLSSITEALTTTKRTVRLKSGEEKVHFASCNIRLSPPTTQQSEELPATTVDVLNNGVPVSSLAFALEALHEPGRWNSAEMNLSGVTMGIPAHESLG